MKGNLRTYLQANIRQFSEVYGVDAVESAIKKLEKIKINSSRDWPSVWELAVWSVMTGFGLTKVSCFTFSFIKQNSVKVVLHEQNQAQTRDGVRSKLTYNSHEILLGSDEEPPASGKWIEIAYSNHDHFDLVVAKE